MIMQTLIQDLRFGLRMLRKQPGIAIICILTLAIGIGSTTAIFSIINTVLVSPLGFTDAGRIVALWETTPRGKQPRYRVAPANFYDWRDQNGSFSSLSAFGAADMTLTGLGDPEQVRGAAVTPSYFEVFKSKPILGRTFLQQDGKPGSETPLILSEALWHRRFASDANVVGRSVTLDGTAYTVVGVLAPGLYPVWPAATGKFSFDQGQQQFYIPLTENAQRRTNRRSHVWGVVGRLRPEVTPEQAQRDMDTIAARLAETYPQFNEGEGIALRPIAEELIGNVRPGLWILFGAVGIVLLVACANVAGLLLARYATRQREVAIRAALGAGRLQLTRQFLTESLLLSILGGAFGVWFAVVGFDVLLKLVPQAIPRLQSISVDRGMLAFAMAVSLLCTILFGLVPAIHAARGANAKGLQEGTRGSRGNSKSILGSTLVVTQVALATVLLIGASLLVRSYNKLQSVPPGFKPERLLVADLNIPASRYGTFQKVASFYKDLGERVLSLPGVESVGFTYDHPLEANWIDSFTIEGKPVSDTSETQSAFLRIVSAGYFEAAGVKLVHGRELTDLDDAQHPGALVINQAFAKRYFSFEDAIGKRVRVTSPITNWGPGLPTVFEVVGIVESERFLGLTVEPPPAYYLSDRQFPQSSMNMVVRSQGVDPLPLVASLRKAVMSLDRDQPIASVRTMDSLLSAHTAQQRLNTMLMSLFGFTALLLSTIGIFGLVSYQVSQRLPEFGIRAALGARPRDIQTLVLGRGVRLALTGVASGLVLAGGLSWSISTLLFGVGSRDVGTFVTVAIILLAVAFFASWLPARRATHVNPMGAMRDE
jgi:putative ABC transport system permease protein